jgi:tRNA nucleotidyltransferase (CCA-adding enzyme)
VQAPRVTVASIMTSPVRSLSPEITVEEAERVMLRYGHSGLPVTDGARVLGVVSRSDVEKAQRHGMGHVPVKGVMSRPAVTISVDTPVAEVQALMLRRDLGRLPVVDHNQHLVGIVSRSDLLRLLYGGVAPQWHQTLYRTPEPTPVPVLQARIHLLPPPLPEILAMAGDLGRDLGMPVYAVGGFVRDLLLGHPNLDLDLVVEGHGITFAGALASRLGGQVEPVPRFGTAHVRARGLRIDVATARREYYSHAAALPTVEHADLRADLYRRDFTINALAVRLDHGMQGELVDLYGGYADLQAGLVRVLHSLSFLEDPTRITRGVRFIARYGFSWEPETRGFALQAVRGGYLAKVSAERLRSERSLLLQEETVVRALRELDALEALSIVVPGADGGPATWRLLDRLDAALAAPVLSTMEVRRDLLVLLVLLRQTPAPDVGRVLTNLRLTRAERRRLEPALLGWAAAWQVLLDPTAKPSALAPVLGALGREGLALLWLLAETLGTGAGNAQARIESYWEEWRSTHLSITGRDLADLGSGAAVGEVLRQVLAAKLDGEVQGRAAELALARRLLAGRRSD